MLRLSHKSSSHFFSRSAISESQKIQNKSTERTGPPPEPEMRNERLLRKSNEYCSTYVLIAVEFLW